MIDGISSSTNYRDWMEYKNQLEMEGVDGEKDPEAAQKIWNAVFTEQKDNAVSADDFLTLMVAQLKNQDFMNPVDDTQYVTQLAQFSTMQQMSDMANYMKTSYVMSLVGKNVTAAKMSVSGNLQKETGPVEQISLVNNEFTFKVNGKSFTLEQLMEINNSNTTSSETVGDADDSQRKNYLLSMAGKQVVISERVAGEDTDEDTVTVRVEGVVEKVSTENGNYRVYVNGGWHSLDNVVEVGGQVVEA